MQLRTFSLAFAMLAAAGVSQAQHTGMYAGAKLGGYTVDSGDLDLSDFAWGGYAGFRINPYLSAEVEYLSLEEESDTLLGENFDAESDLWALSARRFPSQAGSGSWKYTPATPGWLHLPMA